MTLLGLTCQVRPSFTKQDSVYTASAVECAIVTQAKTLEDLFDNIKEPILLYLEDESESSVQPSITIQYDFFQHA